MEANMIKFKIRSKFFYLSLLALTAAFATMLSIAQTDVPPTPDDLSYLFLSDPENYRIIYLVDETALAEGSLLSPTGTLGEVSKAVAATSWEAVIALDAEESIQGLIIHESAYEMVDQAWTAAAWRRGVAFAGINIGYLEYAELRGDECSRRKAETYRLPFTGDYYFSSVQLAIATNPEQQILLDESILTLCKKNHGIPSYTGRSGGNGHLSNERDIYSFVAKIIGDIEKVKDMRYNFENRFSPTPVPTFEGQ
jgi:hypothetical protein